MSWIYRLIFVFILFCVFIQAPDQAFAQSEGLALDYKIINKEIGKKGAQLYPLIRPKYIFVSVVAILENAEGFTEKDIKNTLDTIIAETRSTDNPDGISIFLHQSMDNAKGSTIPFASAGWWPKGHSLAPRNAKNIRNKNTYETDYNIMMPGTVDESDVITRLSESQRREIYAALVKSEDRGNDEAAKKYPISGSEIPLNELRTYDFKTAFRRFGDESDRLKTKYKKQLLKKYRISKKELSKISTEGFIKNWPMPEYEP